LPRRRREPRRRRGGAVMSTPDHTATWRDLADQLTPQQVAELEYCEREGIPPGMAEPRHQLNCAREMARHNLIQELCADIAPADALGQVNEWEGWGDGYGRMFTCSTRAVDTMSVEVIGIQHDDGQIERYVLA
jgi:hypothetical protein